MSVTRQQRPGGERAGRSVSCAGVLLLGLALAPRAWAHKPFFADGAHGREADALVVADPTTSIVVYHDATCESSDLWLEFSGTAGDAVFLQMGLPALEGLATFRPKLALLGPGLPGDASAQESLPGSGALVFDSTDVSDPEPFYEPFSKTNNWILFEQTVTLPATGTYHVVAWPPERTTGKLWVAIGTEERFTPEDLVLLPTWFAKIQAFFAPAPGGVETLACPLEDSCPG